MIIANNGKWRLAEYFASGLRMPLDTATLHATFDNAPRNTLRATYAAHGVAYSMPIPKAAPTCACVTCATTNIRKVEIYRFRSPCSPNTQATQRPHRRPVEPRSLVHSNVDSPTGRESSVNSPLPSVSSLLTVRILPRGMPAASFGNARQQ